MATNFLGVFRFFSTRTASTYELNKRVEERGGINWIIATKGLIEHGLAHPLATFSSKMQHIARTTRSAFFHDIQHLTSDVLGAFNMVNTVVKYTSLLSSGYASTIAKMVRLSQPGSDDSVVL